MSDRVFISFTHKDRGDVIEKIVSVDRLEETREQLIAQGYEIEGAWGEELSDSPVMVRESSTASGEWWAAGRVLLAIVLWLPLIVGFLLMVMGAVK